MLGKGRQTRLTATLAIMSICYRLAAESTFPKALEDCHNATKLLVDYSLSHFGAPSRFAGGGVSRFLSDQPIAYSNRLYLSSRR